MSNAVFSFIYFLGHEIAVHTLTHRTPTTFWASASYEELLHEIVGMKRKLESYGIKDIVGYRNPFLQTAGDRTFSVLKDHGFLYDSTLPANIENIWWPYTLEYNENRPCVINPCPDSKIIFLHSFLIFGIEDIWMIMFPF